MNPIKYKFNHPLDAPGRTLEHGKIIRNKSFLKKLYLSWYQMLFDQIPDSQGKFIVELGSGAGFLKDLAPHIITSDFLDLPGNDLCFSALDMPFDEKSIDGLFMIDTFHHLPDAHLFLSEAQRTLRQGGRMIMIEPANSWWGRFIYQNFHHEPFKPSSDWNIPSSGPLSGANGALPWIVFERDRAKFESEFPHLRISTIHYHTPLRYLLSGGVSYRQLVPDFAYPFFTTFDRLLSGISRQISMFMTVVVEKV